MDEKKEDQQTTDQKDQQTTDQKYQQTTDQKYQQTPDQKDQQTIDQNEQLTMAKQAIADLTAEISTLKAMLNEKFKVTDTPPSPESEIENYLESTDSMTGRLLESYKERK